MSEALVHVVKLGGSLLDLPDVVDRFEQWRCEHLIGRSLLVVGGGVSADTVRHFDRHAELGEEAGHWLAVRAMSLNNHILAAVLPRAQLVNDFTDAHRVWHGGDLAIVEPTAWLKSDERAGRGVPHRWSFTSDSIAAHIATCIGASRLTLLKSTLCAEATMTEAARAGVVDCDFPIAARDVPEVMLVNLRDDAAPGQCLK